MGRLQQPRDPYRGPIESQTPRGARPNIVREPELRRMQQQVTAAAEELAFPPTGTGMRHVTAGVEDAAAKLIEDTDVAAANLDGITTRASMRTLGTGAQQACAGNDARLSDARTPLAHVHSAADVTSGTLAIARGGTAAGTAVAANDALNVQGADIASAATTDLAAATGDYVRVTGTTTITALGTAAAGVDRTVEFTGSLTLTHNATSLILPGAANITTAAGDVGVFVSKGSGNWKCVTYHKAALAPLGTVTTFARTVLDDADAATARATLGAAATTHTHEGTEVRITDPGWTGRLAGSGVDNVQELADFIDTMP